MTWFAKRPTAQAKAATICSLLPWPDDPAEQQRLQQLVRDAMEGRFAAVDALNKEIVASHPTPVSTLDPFSGRGMLPLETARLGLPAYAIDYSPVAVLASRLLTDFPFRNWENEPALPLDQTLLELELGSSATSTRCFVKSRRDTNTPWRSFTPQLAAGRLGAICGRSPCRVRNARVRSR